jgi:hypothetical protein
LIDHLAQIDVRGASISTNSPMFMSENKGKESPSMSRQTSNMSSASKSLVKGTLDPDLGSYFI